MNLSTMRPSDIQALIHLFSASASIVDSSSFLSMIVLALLSFRSNILSSQRAAHSNLNKSNGPGPNRFAPQTLTTFVSPFFVSQLREEGKCLGEMGIIYDPIPIRLALQRAPSLPSPPPLSLHPLRRDGRSSIDDQGVCPFSFSKSSSSRES